MNQVIECPPVLIVGFNRPDCLAKVFARVREAKPRKLFLVLDGPRTGRDDDVANESCKRVFEGVDWLCDVVRDYSPKNLGCKVRMETGISRMFEDVEFGVILEDDCVPHPDFFRFAAEMDEKYRDAEMIGCVCSSAPSAVDSVLPCDVSYYFDRFPYIWGWGTWKRTWVKYFETTKAWQEVNQSKCVGKIFPNWIRRRIGTRNFNRICTTRHEEWDGIWWLTILMNDMMCIHPNGNLMCNIGGEGLHARGFTVGIHGRIYRPMDWPLKHPKQVIHSEKTERILAIKYAPITPRNLLRVVL